MPRAIGANSRLLMIPEVTYGTAPSGNWRRVPVLSCNLGAEQPQLDADVMASAAIAIPPRHSLTPSPSRATSSPRWT
ncbi:MAG: hypothetical protein O9325_00260 [Roseomonas sp.]|nr:hypothetical protein [Roseomonas sp.]